MCLLHNFIIDKRQQNISSRKDDKFRIIFDKAGGLRRKKSSGLRFSARNATRANLAMRDAVKNYYFNDDRFSWQLDSVNIGRINL